jgi:hypothetical protein
VKDPVLGFDGDMLISKVTYSLSAQGSITTLQRRAPAYLRRQPDTPEKNPGLTPNPVGVSLLAIAVRPVSGRLP